MGCITGCANFIVKYILFFVNLFFVLAGLGILITGIAVQLTITEVTDILDSANITVAPVFTIIVGSIVFVIAFFGCCGAIKKNSCMLYTYSIFMFLLMVAQVVLASIIFTNLQSFLREITDALEKTFNNDPQNFQVVERAFSCCGPNGVSSYVNGVLSATCCPTEAFPCNADNAFGGCNNIVEDFFNTFGLAIGSVVILVAAVELVAVVFSCCLANSSRSKKNTV